MSYFFSCCNLFSAIVEKDVSFRPKTTYRQHNTGIRDGTYGPCSIQDGRATPQHNVCLSGSHHSQRLRHQGQSCVSPLLTVPTTVSNCDCLSASSKSTTQGELDLPGLWILNYIRKLFYDAWLPQGINISKQCNPLVARSPAASYLPVGDHTNSLRGKGTWLRV